MCLAMPRRVLRVGGEGAEIEWDGESLWVSTAGTPDLAVGDYVLVHAGVAISRIDDAEAQRVLAALAELDLEPGSPPASVSPL